LFNIIIDKVKAFFSKSWSVFIARLEVFTGFLLGVFGGIDWTALTTLDWSDAIYSKNNLIFAGVLILKGVISEIGRRAGTVTTVNDQLVPVNIAKKAKVEIK
jgi:hypothetical protein